MPDLKPIAAKIKEADAILIGASNGLFITEGLHLLRTMGPLKDCLGILNGSMALGAFCRA